MVNEYVHTHLTISTMIFESSFFFEKLENLAKIE
jgi:hypothetical protein